MIVNDVELRDYAYLKRLGDCYKLVKCNSVRKKGYERLEVHNETFVENIYRRNGYKLDVFKYESKKTYVDLSAPGIGNEKIKDNSSEEKLNNNIMRARNKILEYVLCNDFDYFVTLTLNPDMYDRHNLKSFISSFGYFIQNYNRRNLANIKYLLIPEQHEDGCWHMHGFIKGLPMDRLKLFELHGERPLPPYIINKLRKDEKLYYFPAYEKRYGYNIFEPIKNKKASALYMCKYLMKDASRNVTELGLHLYYCSKGLKRAEIIKEGQFLDCDFNFDFKNQYCGQSFFDSLSDDELDDLKNKIGGNPLTLDDYRRGYRMDDGFECAYDKDTGEIFGKLPDESIFESEV